jgi:16S rRNA (uracil1498-N3)-methyltransferase
MRAPRIFVADRLDTGAEVVLAEAASNHLLRVLRLRPGAALTAFNGEGGEFDAVLKGVERDRVRLAIGPFRPQNVESPLAITLAQGISRGERMDYTLQKAAELGAARIVPLTTAFCQVRLEGERLERRMEHWRGVMIGACEQCWRTLVPELSPVQPLSDWLAAERRSAKPALRLVFDPDGDRRLSDCERTTRITLLIGPEGGLDGHEVQAAREAGFTAVRFGPRLLRTESAGPAAIAALQTLWGDG